MAINTQQLATALADSLKNALNTAVPPLGDSPTEAQSEIRAQVLAIHASIGTKFGIDASLALQAFVEALDVSLTKDLELSVNKGQAVIGEVTNTAVTGKTSAAGTGVVPKGQNNIGKVG